MKYVVFTTKHHDGFSMFDTKYTGYGKVDLLWFDLNGVSKEKKVFLPGYNKPPGWQKNGKGFLINEQKDY